MEHLHMTQVARTEEETYAVINRGNYIYDYDYKYDCEIREVLQGSSLDPAQCLEIPQT